MLSVIFKFVRHLIILILCVIKNLIGEFFVGVTNSAGLKIFAFITRLIILTLNKIYQYNLPYHRTTVSAFGGYISADRRAQSTHPMPYANTTPAGLQCPNGTYPNNVLINQIPPPPYAINHHV